MAVGGIRGSGCRSLRGLLLALEAELGTKLLPSLLLSRHGALEAAWRVWESPVG